MLLENKSAFAQFEQIHHLYALQPEKYQLEFNQAGKPIMEICKDYENRLCRFSEKGSYAKFSTKLAEKFWEQVRKKYPKIDFVGVKLSSPDMEIKRIKLA